MDRTTERDVSGKRFAFVGGTAGIGFATAQALARRGATVAVIGRDATRGQAAAETLKRDGAREATYLRGDLGTIAGALAAAEAIRAWAPALHGLVHSAMTVAWRRTETGDGLENAFGLQYLARFAINLALLPALANSGDGRIVHVGADAPAGTKLDLDDLQFTRRRWSLLASLMSSQVLGHLHVQEAARRWKELPVTATVAAVGPTRTDSVRGAPWWARALYRLIATTPERSAANVIRLLTAADAREANGALLRNPKRYASTALALDAALATRVWDLSGERVAALGPSAGASSTSRTS